MQACVLPLPARPPPVTEPSRPLARSAPLRLLSWAVLLLGLLACRSEPTAQTTTAAAPAPSGQRVVRLGYQKIGTPFLLRARSEPPERRQLIPAAIRVQEAFLSAAAYTSRCRIRARGTGAPRRAGPQGSGNSVSRFCSRLEPVSVTVPR